jgi:hypothetical protein
MQQMRMERGKKVEDSACVSVKRGLSPHSKTGEVGSVTIYVDELRAYGNRQWCHMATDGGVLGDLSELHDMAARVGLKVSWFQNHARVPHYDLVTSKRQLAIRYGAVEVTAKELFEKCVIKAGEA